MTGCPALRDRVRWPRGSGCGGELFFTPATAKTHVSRLLMKLGARDRTQLVVAAYESGLVEPHTP